MAIPSELKEALRPVTVVVGHYGAGKTNFCVNLALDLAGKGAKVTVIDLDIVNPYFRATEQRALLEEHGAGLVAPVFAEAGTSLDVPSLTGGVVPAIQSAGEGRFVIIDAGGDDAGAMALGRYAWHIDGLGYAMLYIANRFRNLVQDPADALENLREIEAASHLRATAVVNNSHLKDVTTPDDIAAGEAHARALAALAGLPLVATTIPAGVSAEVPNCYPVAQYVASPWE